MGRSGGMVGTLDTGMSIDVSSSGSPRECSDSMEGKLEVDGWEGWLSGGSCDLVSVSPSSFWSVGPLSSSPPSSPPPSPSSPLTYEIKFRGLHTPSNLLTPLTHAPSLPSSLPPFLPPSLPPPSLPFTHIFI